MRDRFAERGFFCCRIPGTWEKDDQQDHILMVPMKHVFEADLRNIYYSIIPTIFYL